MEINKIQVRGDGMSKVYKINKDETPNARTFNLGTILILTLEIHVTLANF